MTTLELKRFTTSPAMRWFTRWITALCVVFIAVAVSYYWLDRPIGLAMHQTVVVTGGNGWWRALTKIPNPLVPLAAVMVLLIGVKIARRRPLSRLQAVVFVAGLATVIAEVLKEELKFAFGRTWPESWTGTNPSFIRDGVYGFHPFHGGGAYNSFPSGHTATAWAILAVLWVAYPKARPLWLTGGLLVASGLVIANYHFLGDVIAGAFLGGTIGLLFASIWRAQNMRSPY